MSENRPIQLGLCCLNTVLREQKPPVFSSRTLILRTLAEKGVDELKSRVIQNLKDTIKLIEWNEANGIKLFRLSSELFPHKSNPKAVDYTFDFAKELLIEIGKTARKYNQRLTFHPGQYNVVGTPDKAKFEQTIANLSYHTDVLDLMRMDHNSIMIVHGGGVYGDKVQTIERWCEQYHMLPQKIKNRLVLENCEKSYSIEDCLLISRRVNIPIVFDTHHYECYNQLHPENQMKPAAEYMANILDSWKRRGIKPKFHISEQGSGRVGHHSDYVETIPDYLLEIPDKYGVDIDIMIEAKAKEQAVLRLYKKYPQLNCKKRYKFKFTNQIEKSHYK